MTVRSATSSPSLECSCNAASDGLDMPLALPPAKSSMTSSYRSRLRTDAEDLAHHAEGGTCSDVRPGLLRPQMVEPGVAIVGSHLDEGSPSLGGGSSGCVCCYGYRHNLSWVNIVPRKKVSNPPKASIFIHFKN